MNKRLKELMLEAGYAAPELAGRALKLAELIIEECLTIIDSASGVGDDDVIQIERDVSRHFGRDTTSADEYLKSVGRE